MNHHDAADPRAFYCDLRIIRESFAEPIKITLGFRPNQYCLVSNTYMLNTNNSYKEKKTKTMLPSSTISSHLQKVLRKISLRKQNYSCLQTMIQNHVILQSIYNH